jgi:hypothetical protein
VPAGEGARAGREAPGRERRLRVRAAANVGPAPGVRARVRVCDRGADSFEYLEYMARHGLPFVFRSCQNRALQVEAGHAGPRLLHDYLRALPGQAGWSVAVSARPGRPGRVAEVKAAAARVRVRAPRVHSGEHGRGPRAAWAVRVWEPSPPAGAGPRGWMLLADREPGGAGQPRRVVGCYECRGVVEEYPKGQETGVGIEAPPLQSRAGPGPMIALRSVAAVAPVSLRAAARREERAGRPAREVVDPLRV